MNYIYRNAEESDAKAVTALFKESVRYHEKWDVDLDQEWDGLDYFKNAINKNFVYVCLDKDEVVGCIVGKALDVPFYKVKTAELLHIAVKSEYRSKNIGRLLSDKFENHLKDLGCKSVYVTYSTDNIRAGDFYTNNNYKSCYTILRKEL